MIGTGLLISYNLQRHHLHQIVPSFHLKLQASFNPVFDFFNVKRVSSKGDVAESIFSMALHKIIVQCLATAFIF